MWYNLCWFHDSGFFLRVHGFSFLRGCFEFVQQVVKRVLLHNENRCDRQMWSGLPVLCVGEDA